jgi:hypothetical protein
MKRTLSSWQLRLPDSGINDSWSPKGSITVYCPRPPFAFGETIVAIPAVCPEVARLVIESPVMRDLLIEMASSVSHHYNVRIREILDRIDVEVPVPPPAVEQEQVDLDELKTAIQKIKLSTFDYLRDVARWSETDLKHAGYGGKTNAEAMALVHAAALKSIDKLTKDHLKKYPD